METDCKTLKRNVEYLKKVIREYREEDLIEFSEEISKKVNEIGAEEDEQD
jgi:hypothetical protein